MGRKACENLPGVGLRLYVKYDGDACGNVSACVDRLTDRQTDRGKKEEGSGVNDRYKDKRTLPPFYVCAVIPG